VAKLNEKLVGEAIVKARGNLAQVARKFGVSRQAAWKFVESRPALKAICHDEREGMIDEAESALNAAVRAGEAWAVCFFLKTQGKSRGYIEKAEVEHDMKAAVKIVKVIVDANDTPGSEAAQNPGPVQQQSS
jgi:hypothetical protein